MTQSYKNNEGKYFYEIEGELFTFEYGVLIPSSVKVNTLIAIPFSYDAPYYMSVSLSSADICFTNNVVTRRFYYYNKESGIFIGCHVENSSTKGDLIPMYEEIDTFEFVKNINPCGCTSEEAERMFFINPNFEYIVNCFLSNVSRLMFDNDCINNLNNLRERFINRIENKMYEQHLLGKMDINNYVKNNSKNIWEQNLEFKYFGKTLTFIFSISYRDKGTYYHTLKSFSLC